MINVDAITRQFGNIISHNIAISVLLISRDRAKRPRAYAATKFRNLVNIKITEKKNLPVTHPHSSQATSFTAFTKIAQLIQAHSLHYIPTNYPLSQHFLFR